MKRHWKNHMTLQNIPKQSWDFSLVCNAQILSMTVQGEDRIPRLEKLTGETCDISTEWLDFGFHNRVWCKKKKAKGF